MRLFTGRVYQVPVNDPDQHATNITVIAPKSV
jgi:hypothetical protein